MSMICELILTNEAELEQLLGEPDGIEELIENADDSSRLDLEKTWHGLHYLLTGTAEAGTAPLDFLVAGDEVDGTDMGYGSARYVRAEQVKLLAWALDRFSESDLRKRFNPEQMMARELYPSIWDQDPKEDDTLGWLLSSFAALQTFIRGAAERGQTLIAFIS